MTKLLKSSVLNRTAAMIVREECRWFDIWHNVDTAVNDPGAAHDSINLPYQPTRPGRMRIMLRDLPIEDYSRYTFVDFGSGKGRALLIASEFPFELVLGIELRRDLHERAIENIRRCRFMRSRSARIESLNLNAAEYRFPNTPLVLYFYNPFGRVVMEPVMRSLSRSLETIPRETFVVMFNPECASVADSVPQLKLHAAETSYRVYKSDVCRRTA